MIRGCCPAWDLPSAASTSTRCCRPWPALGAAGPLRDHVADPRRGAGGRTRRCRRGARQRAHRARHRSGAEAPLARAAARWLGRRGPGAASRRHPACGARPALPAAYRGPGAGGGDHAPCPRAPGARQPDHRQGADARHAGARAGPEDRGASSARPAGLCPPAGPRAARDRTRHGPAARRPEGRDRRAARRRPAAAGRRRPLQRPERPRPLGRRRQA